MRRETRKKYNRAIKEGIPILLGSIQKGQIWVWCPFCRKFHFHGVGPNDDGEGLRGAHCKNYPKKSLYSGFKGSYMVLNIENLKDDKGLFEDPTYRFDEDTGKSHSRDKYRLDESF